MKQNISNMQKTQNRELVKIRIIAGIGVVLAVLIGWFLPVTI